MLPERRDSWRRRLPSNTLLAVKRRPLLTLPDGRVVLQRTITSARDFVAAAPSLGALPQQCGCSWTRTFRTV
jgi:hypothetical protein